MNLTPSATLQGKEATDYLRRSGESWATLDFGEDSSISVTNAAPDIACWVDRMLLRLDGVVKTHLRHNPPSNAIKIIAPDLLVPTLIDDHNYFIATMDRLNIGLDTPMDDDTMNGIADAITEEGSAFISLSMANALHESLDLTDAYPLWYALQLTRDNVPFHFSDSRGMKQVIEEPTKVEFVKDLKRLVRAKATIPTKGLLNPDARKKLAADWSNALRDSVINRGALIELVADAQNLLRGGTRTSFTTVSMLIRQNLSGVPAHERDAGRHQRIQAIISSRPTTRSR